MLDISIARRLGNFQLDVAFAVAGGSTVVVVGASGSGKTTLLRLLAGLDRPDAGHIALAGRQYFDRAAGIDLPAWERAVGFVPQDYALFPHLTVGENVAFGLRAQGLSSAAAASRVMRSLDRFGIASYAQSRPVELSGGQQQRVALARALVLEPDLLLLDEPLSALDLQTRHGIRPELRRLLASLSCVTVYVTHDPGEALVFGDQIAVLEDGRLMQIGPRAEFLRQPRSSYVAAFFGVNLLRGSVLGVSREGLVRVGTAYGEFRATGATAGRGEVVLTVEPGAITLHRERPDQEIANAIPGRIDEMTPQPPAGTRFHVSLDGNPPLLAEIDAREIERLGLREGDPVWASFDPADADCYPA